MSLNSRSTVLVIDDTEDTRRMLRRLLHQEGCQVVEAAHGEAGIAAFQTHHPDVILIDARMPVMDGFTACQRIRNLPNGNTLPIIMVTSLEDKDSIQRAFEVGATDYITKPISPTIIKHRMRHFLHSRTLEKNLAMRNRVLELLNRASSAAASSLDTQESLRQIIQISGQALEVDCAYIYAYHEQWQTVSVIAEYMTPGLNNAMSRLGQGFDLQQMPATAHWLQAPTDFWVFQLETDDSLTPFEQEQYSRYGASTILIVPFYIEGRLFGYLEFWSLYYARVFSLEDISVVVAIANQVGANINNTQLHSALKESEAAMRRYAAELEARNRELDAYTYTIAHDIKTPLQALLNYIVVAADLDKDRLSPEATQFLQKAQEQVQDMGSMVDQLLLLTSVNAAEEISEPLDMERLVQRVLTRFEPALHSAKITVEVGKLPSGIGNSIWVQEIIANLVSNAIKYMGKENPAPRIIISGIRQTGRVRYSVKDNGIGISPENLNRIFQMFARVNQGDGHGFGLGLAIVDRLVKKMNGIVGVDSTVGEGSEFWFTLPA